LFRAAQKHLSNFEEISRLISISECTDYVSAEREALKRWAVEEMTQKTMLPITASDA
jgi:hypothetical protein